MKKYITTALLLTTIIFTACAQHRKVARKKIKPIKSSSTASISSVTMSRGACFGRCPIYSVTINSDGLVQYKGRSFTEHIGVYEKKFTPMQASKVLQQFKDYRVDTCSANYELPIADLPGIYYKINRGGKVQEIGNAHFGPGFLKDLARDMDALAQVDNSWKKITADVPE